MPELLGRLQSALADRYRLDREVGAGGMATVIWPGPRSGARERWRSPAELAVHISGSIVRDITEGVAKGRITADESSEEKVAADLGTKAALIAFARECFDRASAAAARIGDAELAARVPTPWKASWPGAVAFRIMNDEFVHHRGQLTAFIRLCGGEPPFLWGFADNAPEYRPRGVPEPAGT